MWKHNFNNNLIQTNKMKKTILTALCSAAGAALGTVVAQFVGNKNTAEETETTAAGQEAAAPAEPAKAPDKPEIKEK